MVRSQAYGWPHGQIEGPPVWDEPCFEQLLAAHKSLSPIRRYLPQPPTGATFEGHATVDALPSSYRLRGYGALLYAMVRTLRPRRIVEIGVFEGFSLLSMAAALRDNGAGHIEGYDLFDAYPYRHADRAAVERRVRTMGLEPWARIDTKDAFEVEPASTDVLHVDVSNNGDTFRQMFERWSPIVAQVILFEGGSRDRDNVEWMHKYGKAPIAPAIDELRLAYPAWRFTVLTPFPSMTVACRQA